MLKCQSELFQPSLKLVDGLKMNTKEELKRMAKILLLPVPTKLHKDEYVTYFAEAVLTCPEMWLSRLTHYELALTPGGPASRSWRWSGCTADVRNRCNGPGGRVPC